MTGNAFAAEIVVFAASCIPSPHRAHAAAATLHSGCASDP
jgi:hypothetical protein